MKRFGVLAALAVWSALLAVGCSAGERRALRVGNGTEVQGLDPHTVTGIPEHRVLGTLFEGLVDVDPGTLEPIPAVAESWTVSEDGRVYTFHLRDSARWSNGDAVTAGDFAYAWQRILTPALASEYGYMLHCIENARAFHEGRLSDFGQVGVKVVDDLTLEVLLEAPTPYFLQMQIHYTWFPVHRPTIERYGRMDERNSKWTRPGSLVGNGAFVLTRWVPNNIIEVDRNPHYWNAANVQLERIFFYPTDNLLTEERSFRTKRLDITENVPIAKVPVYREKHPEYLQIDPYLGSYYYRINVTRPPMNDARVRRAFAMAVDRKTLVEQVLTGGQRPAGAFTVPDTAGYTCRAQIPYDPVGAQALLGEAGYPGGRGFPKVELLYNTSENHKLIAEAVQRMWKQTLGVDVALVNQDWKVYLDSQNTLNYDLCRAGWIGDYVDPINYLECFTTGNGNNRTGWSSAEYDRLIQESREALGRHERYELFQEAEALLLAEAPLVPIYYYTRVYLRSTAVKGWKSNLLGYISFKSLYLEEDGA